MTTAKWILVVGFTLAWIRFGNAGCFTAWGTHGHCINIKKCEKLYGLLKKRPVPPTVFNILKKAQCGFEGLDPKVCCENDHSDYSMGLTTVTKIFTTTTTTTRKPTPLSEDLPIDDHPNRRLLDDEDCGPIPESRIFGGNSTALYEFPWMALLGYDVPHNNSQFRCGGTLINKRYVLTAAHCTTQLPDKMKLVKVRIGDYDLSTERDCDMYEYGEGINCAAKYQEFGIERVHIHPHFSKGQLHNDVALIRLNGKADMEPPSVRPICLPLGRAADLKAEKFIVTGWGSTEFGFRSDKLLKISIPVVTLEQCRRVYRRRVLIWGKQICAGGARRIDSCTGDSGGPLQAMAFYKGKPRFVQYGIVSFGSRICGIEGFPGVYTSVAHYVRWILDQITE